MIIYYFLTNLVTGEKIIAPFDIFLGDIGEKIILSKTNFLINDYAIEYEDL
jgi:hypothetical protein